MRAIRQFWQSGWIGKVVLIATGLFGLLVVCCVLLVVVVPRPPQSASSATAVAPRPLARTASAPSAPESTATPAQTATPEPTQTPVPTDIPLPTPIPSVGQDVQVDQVRWKILSAEALGNTLKSDNQFIKDKTTSGRFIKVRFEMENLSKDMLSFAGFDLVDDQQRTFKSASDTFQFIPTEEVCMFENLNPNVAKTCTVIYEVPVDAAHLMAHVGDLKVLGNKSALIDLGLK